MIPKIIKYFKDNYKENVSPYLKTKSGKLALTCGTLGTVLALTLSVALTIAPESLQSQRTTWLTAMSVGLSIFGILISGILSVGFILKQLLFVSVYKETTLYYERAKLLVSMFLFSISCLKVDTVLWQLYIAPIIVVIGILGFFEYFTNKKSQFHSIEQPKENAVLDEMRVDKNNLEQELELTHYFKPRD